MFFPHHVSKPRRFVLALTVLTALLASVPGLVLAQNAPIPELLWYRFDGTGTTVPNLASAPPVGTNNATLMGGLTQGGTDLCRQQPAGR